MRKLELALLLGNCLLLAACAGGPKFSEASAGLPKIPEGDGRIYFYRPTEMLFGGAIRPPIYLNGQEVSTCEPHGVSIADVAPGNYEASVSTEVERKVTFTVAAGEEKFVRCYVRPTFVSIGYANVELVDPTEGRSDIQDFAFTGQSVVATRIAPLGATPVIQTAPAGSTPAR